MISFIILMNEIYGAVFNPYYEIGNFDAGKMVGVLSVDIYLLYMLHMLVLTP